MKKTQIDRAIESLQQEIAVLELAIVKLKAQASQKKSRKAKPVSLTERAG